MKGSNTVHLSDDRKMAGLGPGNTWWDVYRVLDPLGVSVVGGRTAGVGVGGLLLGGGISYLSGKYGWACDNMVNFEVVLASGKIVDVNETNGYSDLFWALEGGSSTNFGIVSRFDVRAFKQGDLWGGTRVYALEKNESLAEVFENFIVDAPGDEDAHLYIGGGNVPAAGGLWDLLDRFMRNRHRMHRFLMG